MPSLRVVAVSALLIVIAGCDEGRPADARGAGTSGDERVRRARREMGLAEAVGGEDEDGEAAEEIERPYAIGPDHVPEMPDEVDPDAEALASGLARAGEALAIARPEPDDALDLAGFQRWVEDEYAAWLRARGEALRVAREALRPGEDGELGEHVVASAVIGLLFARFAEAIGTMPLPQRIDEDDAERLRFRDAFLRTSRPLWDRAADAFGECASATVRAGDRSLVPWQRFCDELAEIAQDAPRPIE